MRITQKRLYQLADLKEIAIFVTLDNIYITYKRKEYKFTGSNKNRRAFDFINEIKEVKLW